MAVLTEEKLLKKAFDVGVVLKGIDGLLEIIGGILLFFLKPQVLDNILRVLTQHELSEDPNDFIANYILQNAQHLSISSKYFGIYYLFSHGIVKIVIVSGLLLNKLWAYKVGLIFLSLSILYQTYRFILNGSMGMLFLTLFDIVVIGLVWKEYCLKLKE